MNKVTIIIPAYNAQEWIADAVESALSQTVRCDVVVIDDGSTDSTASVVKDYPVKLVRQVNKGLPSARNTGIMNSSTEYILPLDADDILNDNCVEKLLEVAEVTGADMVAPSFKSFGKESYQVILMPHPTIEEFRVANRIGYCTLMKREVLLEVGGYSPKMVWGYEDYHLWHDLLKRGKKLVTVPDILWLYRTKEHSMINVAQDHHDELMEQIKKDHYE